jgi:hypothetical protein
MGAFVTMTDRIVLASGERAAGFWSARAALFGFLLLLGFTSVVAAVGYAFPKTNWDILAYLASAHEAPGMSAADLHTFAYDEVRKATTPGEFTVLTGDRDYRVRQYDDPAAFSSMLGFYKVKWLYVEAIRQLSAFTGSLTAIRLISALSAAAIGGLAITWLWSRSALHLAPLAVAALMFSGFGAVARLGTPDAFSAVFLVAGILAFVHKREALTAILLFLAFLARPDHAAYLGVLFAVTLLLRTFSWGVLAAFACAVVAYVPITQAAGHPGWWVQFWFTNVEYVGTLQGFDPAFSLTVYLSAFMRILVRAAVEHVWIAMLIAGGAVWWQMLRYRIAIGRRETAILATTFLAIAAKFAVLPLWDTRFYFAYLTVFALALIGPLSGLRFQLPISATMEDPR